MWQERIAQILPFQIIFLNNYLFKVFNKHTRRKLIEVCACVLFLLVPVLSFSMYFPATLPGITYSKLTIGQGTQYVQS